jgi:hypothetical protein
VLTPEQRSSAAVSAELNQHSVKLTNQGGRPMEVKNNSEAPQLKINWRHLFLVVLHFVVFVLSVCSESFITAKVAARALPQALPV